MWVSFHARKPFAIKVYLGGVNGISGEPMVPNIATYLKQKSGAPRKQDYVVVPSQPWLDGIATRPGLVKQFVAMPYGSGYSVEQQVTGVEVVGGLQFEIIPMYDQGVAFSCEGVYDLTKPPLDIFSTPRDLGIQPGQDLYMRKTEKVVERPTILRDLIPKGPHSLSHTLAVELFQIFSGRLEISVPELNSSISFQVSSNTTKIPIQEGLCELNPAIS